MIRNYKEIPFMLRLILVFQRKKRYTDKHLLEKYQSTMVYKTYKKMIIVYDEEAREER